MTEHKIIISKKLDAIFVKAICEHMATVDELCVKWNVDRHAVPILKREYSKEMREHHVLVPPEISKKTGSSGKLTFLGIEVLTPMEIRVRVTNMTELERQAKKRNLEVEQYIKEKLEAK